MLEICKRNLPITRKVLTRDEAIEAFKARKQDFKVERVSLIPGRRRGLALTQGEFVDLCRGPHVLRTGDCKHLRFTTVAGASWLAIPGTRRCSASTAPPGPPQGAGGAPAPRRGAKQARPRKLGRELGLIMFHEWAPGSVFLAAQGTIVYNHAVRERCASCSSPRVTSR